MRLQTILEQLGYPTNQVKVYLMSLKMGEATASEIAAWIGMPRSTVVELVTHMHKQRLMNYYSVRSRKVWAAEPPDKLRTQLQEKQRLLEDALPRLRVLGQPAGSSKPIMKYFAGIAELKNIFEDVLETKHNIQALISWDDLRAYFGDEFVDSFIERRVTHFLQMKLITPKTESSIALRQQDSKQLRLTRFLPEHIALRRVSNFIYGNKIAMMFLHRKEPAGIIMEDADMVHAMDIYFESLWYHSTE